MHEHEAIHDLLVSLADPPGGPVVAPVHMVVARASAARRQRAAAAVGLVVAVLLAVALPFLVTGRSHKVPAGGPSTRATQSEGDPAGTVAALSRDHWQALPVAPIVVRDDAASAWTGTQMLVWGGGDTTPYSDGAAYTPASWSWQVLPAAPMSGRISPAYTWTGTQLFVFGGYSDVNDGEVRAPASGALYSPATRTWTLLPLAPLSACANGQAVDAGADVFVVGCESAVIDGSSPGPILKFDTTDMRWTTVRSSPSVPGQVKTQAAAVTNGGFYLFETWAKTTPDGSSDGTETSADSVVFRLDIRRGSWAVVPFPGSGPGLSVQNVLTAGSTLVVPNVGNRQPESAGPLPPLDSGFGALFNTATSVWTDTPTGSLGAQNASSVWTGSALLQVDSETAASGPGMGAPTVTPGQAAVWEPGDSSWTSLPTAPGASYDIAIVWTGQQLLEWGAMDRVSSRGNDSSSGVAGSGLVFGP